MKLYDEAFVCRSKNAGPFQVTIDLMFSTIDSYNKVMSSPNFTAENIGKLYHIAPEQVAIKPFERILTVKVVLPRKHGSGSPLDTDVYGSQQHFPLGNLEI
ncbi:MAG: DUF4387 domain-containing protein [Victivallales bacterium]|nr:DUF4387 domain-containing protein [Victivallales bacterium]MBQ7177438.1 DUF4387 domain-containing protein [Victivallales bacterium]